MAIDYTPALERIADVLFSPAAKIVVQDNLDTHKSASLHHTFALGGATRRAHLRAINVKA